MLYYHKGGDYGMKQLHMLAFPLMIVGALNWGLVALFGYNLVESLLGSWPVMVKIVYLAIGASAVHALVSHKEDCKTCADLMKK